MRQPKDSPILRAITRTFDAKAKRIYTPSELAVLVRANLPAWDVEPEPTATSLIEYMLGATVLRRVHLASDHYRKVTRYSWGPPRLYELAVSLAPSAYFSHQTALHLHRLLDGMPGFFYLNREQSAKPADDDEPLDPELLREAFLRPQRSSNYRFSHDGHEFVLLSGKRTDRRDIIVKRGPQRLSVRVTSLERTLIDCAVRPAYAGGAHEVMRAFVRAKRHVSVRRMVAALAALKHRYPYHQALGFYLERAGFDPARLGALRRLGFEYEFYLEHAMERTRFDDNWRIYYPEGL
jgi:hypothetical protein